MLSNTIFAVIFLINMVDFLKKEITDLQGVGTRRAALLKNELGIATYEDLLHHWPFRYEDRSQQQIIKEIKAGMPPIQCKGYINNIRIKLRNHKRILTATLGDQSGTIGLVWLNGIRWVSKHLFPNHFYYVFGKPTLYQGEKVFIHPEFYPAWKTQATEIFVRLFPIYPMTTKLQQGGINNRFIASLQRSVLAMCLSHIQENLPAWIVDDYRLICRHDAFAQIHFPKNMACLQQAQKRFKFEEAFYLQLSIRQMTCCAMEAPATPCFTSTKLVKAFYDHLPFALTKAQQRVIKEIYQDLASGKPMKRLLQGDVGSGKTIVAFISMLFPLAHGYQVAFMAPTEILAIQHYRAICDYAVPLNIRVSLLTGSTTKKARRNIQAGLLEGNLHIIIGTHALLEDAVQFRSLGLVIIDEQHRFGVAQRGKLQNKQGATTPHLLVMTATPIPRTLALTLYSHLDMSVIDELPPHRKIVKTYHVYDSHRLRVFSFIRKKIKQGKQVYIVYPRIEASLHDRYKYVMDGYESVARAFPNVPIGILHGRMNATNKQYEMERFVKGETKIMVSSTVIEVGVNVPNATLIVIESAEVFSLVQLHQLRGRVVRGTEAPHCILITKKQLSPISRERIKTMVATHDGFKIADTDLRLRGPGDLHGLTQSGFPMLNMVDFYKDQTIIKAANEAMQKIWNMDPSLSEEKHFPIQQYLTWLQRSKKQWLQAS